MIRKQAREQMPSGLYISGGGEGNRTPDTGIFSPLLYQLSYPAEGAYFALNQYTKHQKLVKCFLIFFMSLGQQGHKLSAHRRSMHVRPIIPNTVFVCLERNAQFLLRTLQCRNHIHSIQTLVANEIHHKRKQQ